MPIDAAQRKALELQSEFGEGAANVAAERADKCLVKGDVKGFDYWNLVCAMVTRFTRLATSTVH
jgi:hypothetical protein